jgi:hypothetical protein
MKKVIGILRTYLPPSIKLPKLYKPPWSGQGWFSGFALGPVDVEGFSPTYKEQETLLSLKTG